MRLMTLFAATLLLMGCVGATAADVSDDNAADAEAVAARVCLPTAADRQAIAEPQQYKHPVDIPAVGAASGVYGGAILSSSKANKAVTPEKLPNRPFLGTETYWIPDSGDERDWLSQLQLDFLRVQNTPGELEGGKNDDADPFTDFTKFSQTDFEDGSKGWYFGDTSNTVVNIMSNIPTIVQFPYMMMMHYGGESYMGEIPNSDEYAEYFLATVYYYNVIRGMNVKYWEVMNEPDWGWDVSVSPQQYAEVFHKVAERIRNFPDPRVNSIFLGGPALGSGDPIDGSYPNGYANAKSDGGRQWQQYIPTLLQSGSREGKFDVDFVSWHDYGDVWGLPNSIYNLDQNYTLVNRVNAIDHMTDKYVAAGGNCPKLVVSEFNFDAGSTTEEGKALYKSFYAALWSTSSLNNYFSTGKLALISQFDWHGDNNLPKGMVYKDADSGGQAVRNPVWWAYYEYIQHTQTKILASYNGKQNRWADAVVTTDTEGKMFYLIAVNKSDQPQQIDFSFSVPDSLLGNVVISKQSMQKSGDGDYGAPFAAPLISDDYQFQPTTLAAKKQVRYNETVPPRTIVYYTVIRTP